MNKFVYFKYIFHRMLDKILKNPLLRTSLLKIFQNNAEYNNEPKGRLFQE